MKAITYINDVELSIELKKSRVWDLCQVLAVKLGENTLYGGVVSGRINLKDLVDVNVLENIANIAIRNNTFLVFHEVTGDSADVLNKYYWDQAINAYLLLGE